MRSPLGSRSQEQLLRPVWAEVDLSCVRNNLRQLRAAHSEQAVMAVVKADGYGHGAVPVAYTALRSGATWLAVATPEEGILLRQAGIKAPILVLGTFVSGQEEAVVQHELTTTIGTIEAADAAIRCAQAGLTFPVHVNVDTGMGRVGLLPDEAVPLVRKMVEAGVNVDGVYTHFSTADATDLSFAHHQLNVFAKVRKDLQDAGIRPEWLHAANSAASIRLATAGLNMIRVGIAMYGLYPSKEMPHELPLEPALSFRARVVAVRRLPAGSGISYGRTYVTSRATTIVTVPLGYADGYSRLLSNKAECLIGGRRFPVVGAISMDQFMVDVGDFPVHVGDEIVVLGKQGGEEVTADEIADLLGTISYEVLCTIGCRVPRVYTQHPADSDILEHS